MSLIAKDPSKTKKTATPKGESITIRVSPKIKYGVELLARKQHRSVTSVIEWAIDKAMKEDKDGLVSFDINGNKVGDILEDTWDPEPWSRLFKLALRHPALMTYEEELLWKTILKMGSLLWYVSDADTSNMEFWVKRNTFSYLHERMRWNVLKKYWDEINDLSVGIASEEQVMPQICDFVSRCDSLSAASLGPTTEELLTDDDIPF